jgi:hypothetical protein
MGNSAGYDTNGKEDYSHKVVFTLDYSDVEMKMREARDLIGIFGRDLKASMDGINRSGRFITADSDFSNAYDIQATIELPGGPGTDADMAKIGEYFAAESKATIKKYIGGRVDTGRMKGSVYGRTIKRKGRVTAQAGWLDLWFKYFGFQEEGTIHVSPMRSMLRTYLEMAPFVQKYMSQYIRSYTKGEGYKG